MSDTLEIFGIEYTGVTGIVATDNNDVEQIYIRINNQNKTVTPTTSSQSITADSGYTGLGTVTVNPIPSNYGLVTWNGSVLTIS